MATEPPFICLKSTSWLPLEEMDKLLGAVVKNFWAPTDNSVPEEPLYYNKGRTFVKKGYDDFVLTNKDGLGNAAKLKLQGLTELIWKGAVDDAFDLRGKYIRYVKLRQVDKFWKDLKEDSEVKESVPAWIGSWPMKSKPPVCLITGLFICEDVTSTSSVEELHEREATIKAPLGTAAAALGASQGVPLPNNGTGNLKAGFSVNKAQQLHVKVKDQGSSIFAMQLKVIASERFNRRAFILKDKSPDTPAYRQMGEDDELPSVESLELEDVDDQTWEAWEKEDEAFDSAGIV